MKEYMKEDEIVEFLMTSDFNEGHTEEEFRFLLLKFRTLYRILNSKNEQTNYKLLEIECNFDEYKKLSTANNNELTTNINEMGKLLERELVRKLTISERFNGKIKRNKKEI